MCGLRKLKNKRTFLSLLQDLNRANAIFEKSRVLSDNVYKRTENFTSGQELIDHKLHYHKACMRTYECKDISNKSKNDDSLSLENDIIDVIKDLEIEIKSGKIFSLTDIAGIVASKCKLQTPIKNVKIKSYLMECYDESITFITPSQKNLSELFFYTDSLGNIITKIYKHDCVKKCADILKDCMKTIDFQVKDTYCDEYDLRTAWENMSIPKVLEKFL